MTDQNVEYEPRTGRWCDGCFGPIAPHQGRIYRGWTFTGTAWFPPRTGDTTHTDGPCQEAYVARQLLSGRWPWSQRKVARHYGVSRYRVRQWLACVPSDPTGREALR